eukprot:Em0081g5a
MRTVNAGYLILCAKIVVQKRASALKLLNQLREVGIYVIHDLLMIWSLTGYASVTAGSAALAAEKHKHNANDAKCSELGWKCIPLAVESYVFGSQVTFSLYGRLNLALVRANVRALLSRSMSFQDTS